MLDLKKVRVFSIYFLHLSGTRISRVWEENI